MGCILRLQRGGQSRACSGKIAFSIWSMMVCRSHHGRFLELFCSVKPTEAGEVGCFIMSILSGMVQLFLCLGLPEDIVQIASAPLVQGNGKMNMRLTC